MTDLASGTDSVLVEGSRLDRALADVPARRFGRCACVLLAGTPATHLYLVRRGQVWIVVPGDEPGTQTPVAVLGAGQLLGLAAMVGQATYHATAWALTPVQVWALPTAEMLARLGADPTLLEQVVTASAHRLGSGWEMFRARNLLSVRERIAAASVCVRACAGDEAGLSRVALAELVRARRETVSRSIARSARN
jgi:CRP-like cAMP-binding protein